MVELSNSLGSAELPAAWYPLCRGDDVKPGKTIAVQCGGVRYAVWRTHAGKVSALIAQCCHVGADLARGQVVGETLQCPLHHWQYGVDGLCVHIPGGAAIPARARQRVLPCVEAYGLVFGFVGSTELGAPSFALPRFDGEVDPVWSRAAVVDVAAPLATLVANSYDGQHFAAVHGRELIEPPQIHHDSSQHIAIHYRAKVVGQRFNDRLMRGLGIDRVGITIHCWGGSVLHVYNERTANTILVALLPLDEDHTRVFVVTALKQRARGAMRVAQLVQLALSRWLAVAFLRPDMRVLEGVMMRPRVLLKGADDCLVAWLRYWRELPRPEGGEASPPNLEQTASRARLRPILPQPLAIERESLDA